MFDTLINKSRVSEQTFIAQIEISTLNSPFGQSATRGEDFQTSAPGMSTVLLRLLPYETNTPFSYQIIGDNTPENQEVFQLSVTPAIDSPTFTCTQANGCFQQLEVVIVNDDGELWQIFLFFVIQPASLTTIATFCTQIFTVDDCTGRRENLLSCTPLLCM